MKERRKVLDFIEIEDDDVDNAVAVALEKLGVTKDQVDIEVLDKPSKGLLGLGAKGARVKVSLKSQDSGIRAEELVRDILSLMDIEADISREDADDNIMIDISGDNLGLLIGRHGNTLDALQYLVSIGANKNRSVRRRIIVDVEGYRRQRIEDIKGLAARLIGKVLAGHSELELRPMNAFERKVVHDVVGEYDGVTSASVGEGEERHVVISPSM